MHPLIFKEVLPSIITIFFAFAGLRHIAAVRTLLLLQSQHQKQNTINYNL
jgi:hypothetical protein